MNSWFIVEELGGQPFTHGSPVQPKGVSGHGHQHAAHAKVQPACFSQHADTGVHHRPTGACFFQRFKVNRVECLFAQVVVATVHVAPFNRRFTLQFLNEMTMPIKPTDECRQPTPMANGWVRQLRQMRSGLLHSFTHADTAIGQVSR